MQRGLAELGAPVTIDSPFCGTETDRDNDAIRIDHDLAGRGLAAVAHFATTRPRRSPPGRWSCS